MRRVVINAKDFSKELLEIHIPKPEELYVIAFGIKGETQLIQTTSESEPDHPNNNQQDNIQNGKDTQNRNHQQDNTLEKNQNSDNNQNKEQQTRRTHAIRKMTTKQQQKTQTTGYTKYQQIKECLTQT